MLNSVKKRQSHKLLTLCSLCYLFLLSFCLMSCGDVVTPTVITNSPQSVVSILAASTIVVTTADSNLPNTTVPVSAAITTIIAANTDILATPTSVPATFTPVIATATPPPPTNIPIPLTATPFPPTNTLLPATSVPRTNNFKSRGFGLDKASWEQIHGQGKNTGIVSYENGIYLVIFHDDKVWNLTLQFRTGNITLQEARSLIKAFIPDDASLVKTYITQTSDSPVDLFISDSLKGQFVKGENWTGGEPGNFIAIYHYKPGSKTSISSIVIGTGNNP